MILRSLTWIVVVNLAACLHAAEFWGQVLLNELEGPAMANVAVSADGAQPTITDSDGRFVLVFRNKKPGEVVEINVKKGDYVVIHSILLQHILRKDPNASRTKILMAKVSDREEMARRFFRLKVIKAVEQSYRQKRKELEERHQTDVASLFRLRKELDQAKSIRTKILTAEVGDREEMARRFSRLKGIEAVEQSYRQKLKELEERHQTDAASLSRLREKLDQAKSIAARVGEELARDDIGQEPKLYQEAMRLFLAGELDAALDVLDETKLQKRKEDAKRAAQEVSREYRLRGQLLALKFRFADATRAYWSAVETAPDNFDAHFALAHFLQNLNRQKEALAAYSQALELARKINHAPDVAMTLNNLGILHYKEHRMADARKAFEEALNIYQQFAKKSPEKYDRDVKRVQWLIKNLKE